MDCRPPDSSVHWISQTRILEWVAVSFSRGSSSPRDQTLVSHIAATREDAKTCWGEWDSNNLQMQATAELVVEHSIMSDSFEIPWTVPCQTPLSMVFPRQEYWSGLPFPSPGVTKSKLALLPYNRPMNPRDRC